MTTLRSSTLQSQTLTRAAIAAVCITGLFTANVALAQNPHYIDVNAEQDGDQLDVDGRIAGLGNDPTNEDLTITVDVLADVQATCSNPSGKNKQPKGINQKLELQQEQEVDADAIDQNGQFPFAFTFDLGDLSAEFQCPGQNWEQVLDVTVTEVIVTAVQGDDEIVATCVPIGGGAFDCDF